MNNNWDVYSENVNDWFLNRSNQVGSFADDQNEKYYLLSCDIPLPNLQDIPLILLPLRFHLARGEGNLIKILLLQFTMNSIN